MHESFGSSLGGRSRRARDGDDDELDLHGYTTGTHEPRKRPIRTNADSHTEAREFGTSVDCQRRSTTADAPSGGGPGHADSHAASSSGVEPTIYRARSCRRKASTHPQAGERSENHDRRTEIRAGSGDHMANIQKRPNGTWRARYRDSAGKEHARHFARRVDAQAWLDGVTTAVQTGAYVDPVRARKTVGELSEQWLVGKVTSSPRHRRCTSRSSAPTFSRAGATFRSPASSTAMSRCGSLDSWHQACHRVTSGTSSASCREFSGSPCVTGGCRRTRHSAWTFPAGRNADADT